MRPMYVLALAGLLMFGSSSPGWAQQREHQQMIADIRMLQEQTQQLQLLIGSLTKALSDLSAKLDEQAEITRRAFADQRLMVDNLTMDVRILREQLSETNVRISGLSHELEGLRYAVPPQTSQTLDPATDAPFDPGAPSDAAPPLAPGMTPRQLYDMAWADYAAGQWDLAIQGFETYLRSFPTSELASDAQYHIGESFFYDGRFQEAVSAYDQVIARYPGGARVPDAYYKRGRALEQLGQIELARQSFEELIKKYPNSSPALLASQALERISRGNAR